MFKVKRSSLLIVRLVRPHLKVLPEHHWLLDLGHHCLDGFRGLLHYLGLDLFRFSLLGSGLRNEVHGCLSLPLGVLGDIFNLENVLCRVHAWHTRNALKARSQRLLARNE
jgi:hypothetical protein